MVLIVIALCSPVLFHHHLHSYAVLLSAAPDLENADPDDSFATWFSRKLVKLMKRDYFVKLLPHLLNDTVSEFERITVRCGASSGIFNPFEAMNRMVFQLTMRTVGITEIAESQDLLSRSLGLVYEIGENNSRARIIVSWLPTIKYIKRMIAAGRLYMIINGLIRDRKRTGRREDDALQLLLDENESGTKIVEASLPVSPLCHARLNGLQDTNYGNPVGVHRPRHPRGTVELGLQCGLGLLLPRSGSPLEARGTHRSRPCGCQAPNQP